MGFSLSSFLSSSIAVTLLTILQYFLLNKTQAIFKVTFFDFKKFIVGDLDVRKYCFYSKNSIRILTFKKILQNLKAIDHEKTLNIFNQAFISLFPNKNNNCVLIQ